MTPPIRPETVIRRLFRESEMRRSVGLDTLASQAETDSDVADIVGRLDWAATEMDRLRALVASQQGVIYDQKRDLALARRDLAEAVAHGVRFEQSFLAQKDRADQAVANLDRVTDEMTTLRSRFGKVTAAVSRTFERDDNVVMMRGVA